MGSNFLSYHFYPNLCSQFRGWKIRSRHHNGFTLIELLIVIAIILILIAIALPNFLEAQIRAKVTKAKSEIRTLGIAMESYFLDFKTYPAESEHDALTRSRAERGLFWLTSPIAYIGSLPTDNFGDQGLNNEFIYYEMGGAEDQLNDICRFCLATWVIFSQGPDNGETISSDSPHFTPAPPANVSAYAPTNGTKSEGDLYLWGGDGFWFGVSLGGANRQIYRNTGGAADQGMIYNGTFYLHRLPPPS